MIWFHFDGGDADADCTLQSTCSSGVTPGFSSRKDVCLNDLNRILYRLGLRRFSFASSELH